MQTNIQLYAYDQDGVRLELDLYEEDPIKITISAEDIEDIPKIDSAFSRQFRIPGTQKNSKVFKWWYQTGIIDYDVTQKVPAEIYTNGLLFMKGHLRIQAAYINRDTNLIDIELVFFGSTRNFSVQIGEGFMTELDLTDTNHILDASAVYDSWRQWTDSLLFLDGKIKYVLAERGYFYEDNGTGQNYVQLKTTPAFLGDNDYTTGEISYGRTGLSFTDPGYPIRIEQYTPLVQVKYLIDKIFETTEYTYSERSVFSETSPYWETYRNLYIDGISVNSPLVTSVGSDLNVSTGTAYTTDSIGYWDRVKFFNVNLDPSNEWSSTQWQYIVPYSDANYIPQSDVILSYANDIGSNASVEARMMKNSGGVITQLFFDSDTYAGGSYITQTLELNPAGTPLTLLQGDILYIETRCNDVLREPIVEATSFFEINGGPSFVSTGDFMKTDLKIIDFFRSILTKARLVMVPTPVPDLLTGTEFQYMFDILPWDDYIATGDVFNWTDRLDENMDIVMKPVFLDQSLSINFEDPEGNDYNNLDHQNTYNYTFGRLLYDSNNDVLTQERDVTTVFAPTPVSRLDDAPETSRFIIPKLAQYKFDGAPVKPPGSGNDAPHVQAISILPKPRLLFWNGVINTAAGETWYDEFSSHTVIPIVSYMSEPSYFFTFPATVNPNADLSINLNWNREFNAGFDDNGSPAFNSLNGKSVYEQFWAPYIDSLYSTQARIMTAYFVLDAIDLKDVSFDDVIFIRDAWWRVHKIYDAPLNGITSVKVDLIKLLDYVPAQYTGPYTGDSLWSVADPDYSDAGGDWSGS